MFHPKDIRPRRCICSHVLQMQRAASSWTRQAERTKTSAMQVVWQVSCWYGVGCIACSCRRSMLPLSRTHFLSQWKSFKSVNTQVFGYPWLSYSASDQGNKQWNLTLNQQGFSYNGRQYWLRLTYLVALPTPQTNTHTYRESTLNLTITCVRKDPSFNKSTLSSVPLWK